MPARKKAHTNLKRCRPKLADLVTETDYLFNESLNVYTACGWHVWYWNVLSAMRMVCVIIERQTHIVYRVQGTETLIVVGFWKKIFLL